MKGRPRDILLAAAAGLTLLAGLALIAGSFFGFGNAAGQGRSARPTLAEVRKRVGALARAGRFDAAEKEVDAYRRYDARNATALLMQAELALDRPDPKPELALELVRQVRSDDRQLAAQTRLDEGKAYYRLTRYDDAEVAWKAALELDPTIPEAGWALLDLFYLQGRLSEAHRLALRLFDVETDQHDRAQLLLELVREDAEPTDPASIVKQFEPVLKTNPKDLHSTLALGLALVHDSRADEGLELLRRAVTEHSQDTDAWDVLLTGLADANRSEALAKAVEHLPSELAADPRFAKHRGRVAQERRDWKAAASEYRRGWEMDRHDSELLYRLSRTERLAGATEESTQLDRLVRAFEAAREEIRALYEEANNTPTLGTAAHPDLYRRLAALRERMGRGDEARAWQQIAEGFGREDQRP